MWAENRFVTFRNAAFENKIKLMLHFRRIGLLPVDFGNMNEAEDRNLDADFFKTFALKCLFERFARILLATGKRKIMPFHRVLLFLDQQRIAARNKSAGCRADNGPERKRVFRRLDGTFSPLSVRTNKHRTVAQTGFVCNSAAHCCSWYQVEGWWTNIDESCLCG